MAQRRKIIKDSSIDMAPNRAKTSSIAPEYNVEELTSEASSVVSRMKNVAAAETVIDLGVEELGWVRESIAAKRLAKRMPTQQEMNQIVFVQPGEENKFGSYFTVHFEKMDKPAVESMRKAVQDGAMSDPVEFEYTYKRLALRLAVCLSLADYYLQDVVGDKEGLSGPQCRVCQKVADETPEKKLLICARCKAARYCSPECQKKDWGRHKVDCAAAASTSTTAST